MPHSPNASSLPPTTATAAPPPTAAASEPATASSTTPLLGQRLKLLRDGLLGGLGNDKEKTKAITGVGRGLNYRRTGGLSRKYDEAI